MVSTFFRGWAAAEFDLYQAAAPGAGPRRLVRVGRSSPAGLLRGASLPVQLPTRGLSARGRTMAADRRPGGWAKAAGPVRALLARRI